MIKIIIIRSSNLININFIKINHPISIIITIIIQTLFIRIITGTIIERFWLSYILLLTFLGGIIVLFIYITRIASNEIFKIKINRIIIIVYIIIILSTLIYNVDKIISTEIIKNSEIINLNYSINFKEISTSLVKLYNNPTVIITIIIIIYLFITLLAVVKITNINQGPIRKIR